MTRASLDFLQDLAAGVAIVAFTAGIMLVATGTAPILLRLFS